MIFLPPLNSLAKCCLLIGVKNDVSNEHQTIKEEREITKIAVQVIRNILGPENSSYAFAPPNAHREMANFHSKN